MQFVAMPRICQLPQRAVRERFDGFTLLELMVVLAIIGVLMSLLLAGVQASRDMARRAQCANNLRNQVLGLQNVCALFQCFPAGRLVKQNTEYSWCLDILPYVEQSPLAAEFDRTKPWN